MTAWTEHFMVEPKELFKAASASSHAGDFTQAWAKRILYEQDNDFAVAWLEQFGKLDLINTSKSPFAMLETDAYELFEMLTWYELVEVLGHYATSI